MDDFDYPFRRQINAVRRRVTSHETSAAIVDCALLLAMAAIPRFLWLGSASLWIDELFSVYWSQLDLNFLLHEGTRIETNPPAYYLLLHGWMAVFGTTESAIRALPALTSVATVLVVYAIGRMTLDRPMALLAGLFMAVNPVSIRFAQEARSYALLDLLNGLGLLSLLGYARQRKRVGRRSWRWLSAFVVLMIATSWLHYTSLLFVAACFAVIGLYLVTTRPFPVREAAVWTLAGLLIALALAKVLILAAALSHSNNLVWIEKLTATSVTAFFLDVLVPLPRTSAFPALPWVAGAALLLVVVLAFPRLRPGRERVGVLWLIPSIYCGLLVAASWSRPMLLARVATWLQIPLCLILAQAVLAQSSRSRRVAACAVPLLIFLLGLWDYYGYAKEDWRGVARLVATEPRCGGPVLVSEFNALGLAYYGVQARRPVFVFLPDPRRRDSVEFTLTRRVMHVSEIDPASVAGFIEAHPGTVVVLRQEYAKLIPTDFQDLLGHAPFQARLDGDLTVGCF